jgi:hypothetical protein
MIDLSTRLTENRFILTPDLSRVMSVAEILEEHHRKETILDQKTRLIEIEADESDSIHRHSFDISLSKNYFFASDVCACQYDNGKVILYLGRLKERTVPNAQGIDVENIRQLQGITENLERYVIDSIGDRVDCDCPIAARSVGSDDLKMGKELCKVDYGNLLVDIIAKLSGDMFFKGASISSLIGVKGDSRVILEYCNPCYFRNFMKEDGKIYAGHVSVSWITFIPYPALSLNAVVHLPDPHIVSGIRAGEVAVLPTKMHDLANV